MTAVDGAGVDGTGGAMAFHSVDHLQSMVERAMGVRVTAVEEHGSAFGSSRKAFVAQTSAGRVFLRGAMPGAGLEATTFTLARESRVLGELAKAGLPVPTPLFMSDDGTVAGMTWLEGDAGPRGDHATRIRLARSYAEAISTLAAVVDPATVFRAEHINATTTADAVAVELQRWRAIATPSFLADPIGAAMLDWLDAHRTDDTTPAAVVHGDAGHGNFLVVDDRITGLIDWELCHLGDPLEDLACMQMRSLNRDAAVWSDVLRAMHRERGIAPDRARLGWERIHVLIRSAVAMRRSVDQGNQGRPHAPFARYEIENLLLSLVEVAKLVADELAEPVDDLAALMTEAMRRRMECRSPSARLVDAGFAFAYPEVDRDAHPR